MEKEIKELAKEKAFQQKLLLQIQEDDKIEEENPLFQKLERLEAQNDYLEERMKYESKLLKISEAALKKICLVNAKIDMNRITQNELENFRTSKIDLIFIYIVFRF